MLISGGTVRSLKFTKAGNHLLAGNDYGEIFVLDISRGIPIDIIQSYSTKAIWSIDVSWDDQLVALGSEEGTIELYNLQKILLSTSSSGGVGGGGKVPLTGGVVVH